MAGSAIRMVTIHRLRIPLRRKVAHARHQREVSEPVVVSIELQNGVTGFGETLPRPYVTGETVESVVADLMQLFLPRLLGFQPASFPNALECIDAMPFYDGSGRVVSAARAAVELALLDAYSRFFGRTMADAVGWMGLAGFGLPGSLRSVRCSGVLASESIRSTIKMLRLMWLGGFRHFKLKIGFPDDDTRLAAVMRRMERAIAKGKATLRIDVNGVWTKDVAVEQLYELQKYPLAGIEQPLARGDEAELPLIRDLCSAPVFHDESFCTAEDAERLVELGVADGFNIRISKCGGLLPSLRLADFARKRDIQIQIGCMVGETSILSAAFSQFVQLTPGIRFAEGLFGSFLLEDDVIAKSLRFGFGGRIKGLSGPGLGIRVIPERLVNLRAAEPVVLPL